MSQHIPTPDQAAKDRFIAILIVACIVIAVIAGAVGGH